MFYAENSDEPLGGADVREDADHIFVRVDRFDNALQQDCWRQSASGPPLRDGLQTLVRPRVHSIAVVGGRLINHIPTAGCSSPPYSWGVGSEDADSGDAGSGDAGSEDAGLGAAS